MPEVAEPAARRIEVDPTRIGRWVEVFARRHGRLGWMVTDELVELTADDGEVALLRPLLPNPAARPGRPDTLAGWAAQPPTVALLLVRRGGYAVGLAEGGELVAHKAGTRYVQSRTAAGGWSQQRYARRRANQADELVAAVREHLLRVVPPAPQGATHAQALVVGGDRGLVGEVLADRRLGALATLPRRALFDLPDPRLAVLREALRRGRAVQVTLTQP